MDRGSTSAFQTEVVKAANRPLHLVSVHFDDTTVYMTDGYKTITYSGNDYVPMGHLLGFSDIEEAAEVIVSNVTVTLSGVDQVCGLLTKLPVQATSGPNRDETLSRIAGCRMRLNSSGELNLCVRSSKRLLNLTSSLITARRRSKDSVSYRHDIFPARWSF